MSASLENSGVTTGLEMVSFHSNPKERQCQRMLKLLHNCMHLTRQQSNAQNSPSQASTIDEPWTSKCSSSFLKRQMNQWSNCQHPLDHQKSKRIPEKHLLMLYCREGNCTPLQYSCLENPMDRGAWKAAVHGILQARILEWVAIPSSRGSSWPRD